MATTTTAELGVISIDDSAKPTAKKGVNSMHVAIGAGLLLVVVGVAVGVGVAASQPAPPLMPSGPVLHFGFPICYTTFEDYKTDWTNDPPVPQTESTSWYQGTELRPLNTHILLPYQTYAQEQCDATAAPLAALGPHFVGLGLTHYTPGGTLHAFPTSFEGKLFVTAHGSWNRVPWIGHRIDAFDIDDTSEPYTATARSVFVPPMRVVGSGTPDKQVLPDSNPRVASIASCSLMMSHESRLSQIRTRHWRHRRRLHGAAPRRCALEPRRRQPPLHGRPRRFHDIRDR